MNLIQSNNIFSTLINVLRLRSSKVIQDKPIQSDNGGLKSVPKEVWMVVFSHLDLPSLQSTTRVCSRFYVLINKNETSEIFWRKIETTYSPTPTYSKNPKEGVIQSVKSKGKFLSDMPPSSRVLKENDRANDPKKSGPILFAHDSFFAFRDDTLLVWDKKLGNCASYPIEGSFGCKKFITASPEGLFLAGEVTSTILFLKQEGASKKWNKKTVLESKPYMNALLFAPTKNALFVAAYVSVEMFVENKASGKWESKLISKESSIITQLAFGSETLFVGCGNGLKAIKWEKETAKEIFSFLDLQHDYIRALSFNQEHSTLIVVSDKGSCSPNQMTLWQEQVRDKWTCFQTIDFPFFVHSLLSGYGMLFCGNADGSINLWKLDEKGASGQRIVFTNSKDTVISLAFSNGILAASFKDSGGKIAYSSFS